VLTLPPAFSVDSMAVSPDGSVLAGCGGDETIRLWRLIGR
jgi:WD40 repeat protein